MKTCTGGSRTAATAVAIAIVLLLAPTAARAATQESGDRETPPATCIDSDGRKYKCPE